MSSDTIVSSTNISKAVSILSSINIYIGSDITSLVTETDNTVVIDADDTPVVDIAAVLQNDCKYKTPISDELAHQESDIHDCGSSPDFHNFFLQTKQTNARSSDNEDKIVYEKFFKTSNQVPTTECERQTHVLDTTDFNRVQIDIFMIEVQNHNCKIGTRCEVRDQVRKIMNDAGYEKHEGIVKRSDVYIHPNFQTMDTNLQQQR